MSKDRLPDETLRSYHQPEQWLSVVDDIDEYHEKEELRMKLKQIDGGRFHEMLDRTHNVLSRSDTAQYQHFREHYSDHLFTWLQVYGKLEDLEDFEHRE
jgi:hypothetical protein